MLDALCVAFVQLIHPDGSLLARTVVKAICHNAGDLVLPLATRMVFEFFLGRPQWELRPLSSEVTDGGWSW